MPRQDVPYGGAICRLRERIAEIFDKLGEKLHTINGVPGDGDGNVKIVSGSSAVVITNDPTQNEIAVSLDTSQLPAAAVSSVNGQTGAVAITADDVPSDNGDVQTDLDNLAAADVTLQGNINAEALARQNADSTLQTNINAVLASIPDMSVTPDPYKGVERDAQGRAFAADPASGATDKTLTTANWISQTGNSSPNNLVHRYGNETIYNDKLFDSPVKSKYFIVNRYAVTPQNAKYWVKVYTYNNSNRYAVPSFAFNAITREHSDIVNGIAQLNQSSGTVQSVTLKGIVTDNNLKQLFAVSSESADEFTLWFNCDFWQGGLRANLIFSMASNFAADNVTSMNTSGSSQQAYDISSSGYTDENNVTHTFVAYAVMS